MSPIVLLIVSSLYLFAGVSEAIHKNWWWLGFWSCYALANIFWIMATR